MNAPFPPSAVQNVSTAISRPTGRRFLFHGADIDLSATTSGSAGTCSADAILDLRELYSALLKMTVSDLAKCIPAYLDGQSLRRDSQGREALRFVYSKQCQPMLMIACDCLGWDVAVFREAIARRFGTTVERLSRGAAY